MALILKDRVRETSAVTGTGSATLLGAVTGYQAFSVVGNTNTCYYTIADQSGPNWEVGIGTYSNAGPTLARTTVLASSNGGSLVNFTSGTKDVFLTYPSENAVYTSNGPGTSGYVLVSGGAGAASVWTAPTSVVGGAAGSNTQIQYNNSGALGASANFTYNGTTLIASTTPTTNTTGQIRAAADTVNVDLVAFGSTATAFGMWNANEAGVFSGYTLNLMSTGGPIKFASGGNVEQMRIDTSGNVGIGTVTPNKSSSSKAVTLNNASGYVAYEIAVNNTEVWRISSNGSAVFDVTASTQPRIFYTNGSERMRIISDGSVGIGTSAPTTTLSVASAGGAQKRGVYVFSGSGAGSPGGIYLLSATASGGNGATYEAVGQRSDGNGASTFAGMVALAKLRTDAVVANGSILGSVKFGGNSTGTATTNINYSAQIVGIADGTWSSASAQPTALTFYTGSTGIDINSSITEPGTERMRIDSSGVVGIGTSSPIGNLEISSSGSTTQYITSTGTATYTVLGLRNTGASGKSYQLAVGGNAVGTNANSIYIYDASAAATRFLVDTSGNVGIGTSSPSTRLSVVAGTNAGISVNDGTVNTIIYNTSSTYASIGTTTNHSTTFWTNNTERMRISSAGDVLIGSAAVASNTLRYFDIYNTDTGASAGAIIRLITSNAAASGNTTVDMVKYKVGGFVVSNNDTSSANYTSFGVGGTERMRISSAGYVGINTSSPAQQLHIVGNQQLIRFNTTASSSSSMDSTAVNSVIGISAPYGSNPATTNNAGAKWGITFTGNGDLATTIGGVKSASVFAVSEEIGAGYNRAVGLSFFTSSFDASQAESMRITSTGNVGIGTSSPTSTTNYTVLQVNGTNGGFLKLSSGAGGVVGQIYGNSGGLSYVANGSNNFYWYSGTLNSETEKMRITAGGDLLLGTTSNLGARFAVYGTSGGTNNYIQITNPGYGTGTIGVDGTNSNFKIYNSYSSGTLSTGAGIDINTNGVVLIGNNLLATGFAGYAQLEASGSSGGIVINSAGGNICRLIFTKDNASGSEGLIRYNTSDFSMQFWTAATERMRIDGSGYVFMNTTTSSYSGAAARLNVNGGGTSAVVLTTSGGASYGCGYIHNTATTGNNEFFSFGTEATWTSRGTIVYNRGAGLVAYNTTSDYRAKTILGGVDNAVATIGKLKVHKAVMNGATQERPMFIAHELQETAPYAVTGEKDEVDAEGNPKYQQVDASSLVPLLVKAIQELKAEVDSLKQQLGK